MFKLFTRDQIDTKKWDDCINNSKQSIIYGLSWYLDIVSPKWKAFIREEANQYLSVFPIAVNRKFFVNYVYQPPLTQQLGLFSKNNNQEKEELKEVLSFLSKEVNYIHYHLNTNNGQGTGYCKNYSFKPKLTHHLHLNKDYQNIFKAYSENHKRNLKKSASQNLKLSYSEDISMLISLFKNERGAALENVKESVYLKLYSLYKEAYKRNCARLLFATGLNGEVQAGGFFLNHGNYLIYLFGASSPEGKQQGAMTMVFDSVIRDHSGIAGQNKILDFEGSDIEGIARFYKGFGAQAVPYSAIQLNTLPFYIRLFKK